MTPFLPTPFIDFAVKTASLKLLNVVSISFYEHLTRDFPLPDPYLTPSFN
jgi:hypothetical protein